MRRRSSARVNSTGAVIAAATVWPGSTLRVSTMPSMGERMVALPRLISYVDSSALPEATAASAAFWSATARSAAA